MLTTLLALMTMLTAHADLKEDVLAMCDKMQACILDQVEEQNLPPQIKEVLTKQLFEQQCALAMQKYEADIVDSDLEEEAQACVDSLLTKDCEAIMSAQAALRTDECNTFEEAADEAGIDLNQ